MTKRPIYPWIVIALSGLFLYYKYVLQVSLGVMTQPLMKEFNLDGLGMGNLAACYFYAYLLMQLLVGPLLDTFSPKRLTMLAISICVIGGVGFAFSHSIWTASLARALMGIGAAFATISYMKMTTLWFQPRQFAFVGGLLATASMLGSMTGEVPLAMSVDAWGWRTTFLLCSLLGVGLVAIYYFLVSDRQPETEKVSSSKKTSSQWLCWVSVLKNPANWILLLYSGLAFAPLTVFAGLWGNLFFETTYGLTRIDAAGLTTMIFIGFGLGAPVLGYLSERTERRYPFMMFGVLLSLVSCILMVYTPLPLWALRGALFAFGFGTSALMLGFTVGKMLNQLTFAATVVALINSGDALFGGITEPLVGWLLDSGSLTPAGFAYAFIVLPVYLLLAAVSLLCLYYWYPESRVKVELREVPAIQ